MSETPLHPIGYRRPPVVAVLRGLFLVLAVILFLLPFYLLLRNGLSSEDDITSPNWTFIPSHIQWSNFNDLFGDQSIPMLRGLINSLVVATLQTAGQLLLCSLAGYGLARVAYRHANKVFYAVLGTLLIPAAITFVPSFIVVSSFGWLDDLRGLVVPGLFSGFTAFLFRQYFLDFPRELEEAGRIDGLSAWGVYWRIVVPNSFGFFAAIAVIDFIAAWNAFLWPLIIGQSENSYTIQVVLSLFTTQQSPKLNILFLAATVSIVPLILIFAFLQRYLVRGIAETGIKG